MKLLARSILAFTFFIIALSATNSFADVPDSINYSGILTSGGSPVADGPHSVTFKIYDVASGPDPALWTEANTVNTVDGLFTTFLGSVTPLPHSVFSGPNRFLGITVSTDPEMTPRTPIVAVPYAYRIATVDGAVGGSISGNVNLDQSSATSGNLLKGGSPFIHNFGTDNTFVGLDAGNLAMSGSSNTATGFQALNSNTTGNNNTASGNYALYSNTTGSYNTASGFSALVSNTTGAANTASGFRALHYNTTGGNNTASGSAALLRNTTGINNTASGYQALYGNTTGSYNTASGYAALWDNNTGSYNTADGYEALFSNTTGNENTANGLYALVSNTTGDGNTASGASALRFNTTGSGNTATGLSALFYSTGNANTADGDSALITNTAGSGNTATGKKALASNTTGSNNTALGHRANVSTGSLINATAIGANAVVNASNKIRLGDANVTVIEAEVGLTVISDRNAKENIQRADGDAVLRKLRGLNLSSWNLIGHDPKQFRHYGPMAQEFFAAFGHDGVGKIGTPTTINSSDMTGILMIAVQALEKRTSEIEDLQAQIAELRELISER